MNGRPPKKTIAELMWEIAHPKELERIAVEKKEDVKNEETK